MLHHHHILLVAKIALAVGAALAVSTTAHRQGNGLVSPQPVTVFHGGPVNSGGAR